MPVIGTANLPIAPRDTPWDGVGARQRVMDLCAGNIACVSRAFLWRDPGADAKTAGAYSLGFADVIGGRLQIVPRGIAACAGGRGVGAASIPDADKKAVMARICTIYAKVQNSIDGWPDCPFSTTASITADATGTPFEGTIAFEGITTGDGRRIEPGALTWQDGPWPLILNIEAMGHVGTVVGTINEIAREPMSAKTNRITARGALSVSAVPEVADAVQRAAELFDEGAVGVSISLDDMVADEQGDVQNTTAGRIRSVAIVDESAFHLARVTLAASLRAVKTDWFTDPHFGNGSNNPMQDGGDERLVWQEPERPEEQGQYGCPLTITDDGHIFGHAALWGRCHVGYPGTCVRPPKEPAAYRGYLTGERVKGVATGPLVMKTRHAPDHLEAGAASIHYDHTGYAPADVTIGPDAYGIWVSGALRSDATEADVEILRASALSGDWRPIGGKHRLVGILAVNAPGFRVARALAASGALITVGPGCTSCDETASLEDRVRLLEDLAEETILASLDEFAKGSHTHINPPRYVTAHMVAAHGVQKADMPPGIQARHQMHVALHQGAIENASKALAESA